MKIEKKYSISNDSGFSLVEVIVAMGVLGVVSMGSLTLFNKSQKSQNALTTAAVTRDFVEDIRVMMSFSTICTANFLGTPIDPYVNPISFSSIKDASSVIHYETGSDYEERTLKLKAMALENYSSLSPATGRIDLVVDLEKLKSTGGVQSIRRKISLVTNLDGAGKLKTCYAGGVTAANSPQVCEDLGGRYDLNAKRCIFTQLSASDYPNYVSGQSMLHISSQTAANQWAQVGDVLSVEPSGKVFFGPRPNATVQASFASAIGPTNPSVFVSDEISFGNNTDVGTMTANPAGKLMGYLGGNNGHNTLIMGSYNKNVTALGLWNWNGDPNVPGAGWDMGMMARDSMNMRQCIGPSWWCGKPDYLDKAIMNNVANETLKVYENASFTGTVFAGGAALTSDRRLKKNIRLLTDAVPKLLNLRGVEYEWREDSGNSDRGKQLGLIAQEVEAIYPDAVMETPQGFKSIKYPSLIPALIEPIKEIWKEIVARREKAKELESELSKSEEILAAQSKEIQDLKSLICENNLQHPSCSTH